MTIETPRRWFLFCAALAGWMTMGCAFSSGLEIRNLTGRTLTPYPLRTTPPPPRREADPTNDIVGGGIASIDPLGFNPVYYNANITELDRTNGLFLGLQLDDEPYRIQFKLFHYRVPPGEAGTDPALQPILLHQGIEDVSDENLRIIVTRSTPLGEPPTPGDWTVRIRPRP